MNEDSDIWKDDLIDRKEVSSVFTKIVKNTIGSMVASVSAPFGTGKTFFATRWVRQLRAESIPAIYFNAWETDFGEQPLAAFLHTCESQVDQIAVNPQKRRAQRKLKQAINAAAPIFGKTALKMGARVLTLGSIEGDIDKIREALASGLTDATEEHAAALLDTYAKGVNSRQKFKQRMKEFREILNLDDDKKNIVVVIDELERCRPDYALNLLEDIKHFLEEDGFLFFIFCDEKALDSYADRMFGVRNEGEGYLRKFITHKFRLPEPNSGAFARIKFQGIADKLASADTKQVFDVDLCRVLFGGSGLSLRQIERCAQHFEILSMISRPCSDDLNNLVICGLILREMSDEMYKNSLIGGIAFERIRSKFRIEENTRRYLFRLVLFSSELTEIVESQDEYDSLEEMGEETREAVSRFYNNIDNMFLYCRANSLWELRKVVADRLELSSAILDSR